MSTLKMAKKKVEEDYDDEYDEEDEDDLASDEGEGEEGEDVEGSEESDRTIREVTLEDIRRIKAKMKTVGQIMIEGEDVEIGSDSDVSDTSQISINIGYQSGLDFQV